METVKFYYGTTPEHLSAYTKNYSTLYEGAIFFDSINKDIYLDGHVYGNSEASFDISDIEKYLITGGSLKYNKDSQESIISLENGDEELVAEIAITEASQAQPGLMSITDKTKLDGIAQNAEPNVITQITVGDTELTPDIHRSVDISTAIEDAVKNEVGEINSAFVYKGSVSNKEALDQIETKRIGDVYNITNDSDYGPAGTNVAWVMNEGDTTGHWDALGGTFNTGDISGNITALTNKVNTLIGSDEGQSVNAIATDIIKSALTWQTITLV